MNYVFAGRLQNVFQGCLINIIIKITGPLGTTVLFYNK